jgi:hypothetical protein
VQGTAKKRKSMYNLPIFWLQRKFCMVVDDMYNLLKFGLLHSPLDGAAGYGIDMGQISYRKTRWCVEVA